MDIASVLGGTRRELVADISWAEYKNLPALNPSTIVVGQKSLFHLRYAWDHPREDTDDLRWGRAVHCLLFEPKTFDARYKPWKGRRAGKEYQDFRFECWESGAEVLTVEQYETAQEAALSFVHHAAVRSLIKAGQSEVTLFEVEGNIQCRGRVDWISSSEHVLVDLKTAKRIERRPFSKDFYGYHYDIKMGLYQRWLDRLTGEHWPVSLIVIEKEPPYDVAIFPREGYLPDAVLERGARKGLDILAGVEESIRTGFWPGVGDAQDYYLDTPSWEMDGDELEGAVEWEGCF